MVQLVSEVETAPHDLVPREERAGVVLAVRRDVLMPRDPGRVEVEHGRQNAHEPYDRLDLSACKGVPVAVAGDLDADRRAVQGHAAMQERDARMPRPVLERDELPEASASLPPTDRQRSQKRRSVSRRTGSRCSASGFARASASVVSARGTGGMRTACFWTRTG